MQKREVCLLRYVRDEPQTRVPTPLSESLRRFGLASPDGDLLQVYTQNGTRIYPVGGYLTRRMAGFHLPNLLFQSDADRRPHAPSLAARRHD
jgi:hypothetical protein